MYNLYDIVHHAKYDDWFMKGFNDFKKIVIYDWRSWRRKYIFKKIRSGEKYFCIYFENTKKYIFKQTFYSPRCFDVETFLISQIKDIEQFKSEYESEKLFLKRFTVKFEND